MVIRSGLVMLCLVFASSVALAEETPYAVRDTSVTASRSSDQVAFNATGAYGAFIRAKDSADGFALGGEAAYVFRGVHGIRLGYLYGEGLFGPQLHIVDLDYSAQWTSRRSHGWSASIGALLGPSLGIVSYGGQTPDAHATFGGRTGVFADVHFWWLTLGMDASYRVGLSSGYGAESFGSVGVHGGVTFDLAQR